MLSLIKDLQRALTTNHARLDSESADVLLRPLTLPHSADEVARRIAAWVESQPRWSLQSRQDMGSQIALHLTRATRLVRFVDDIHVRLEAEGEATHVEAESQSRIGKGDLGQNRRNLRELISGLRADGWADESAFFHEP